MKSCFLNLNAKSKWFFMFEFHNDRIYFSALIKSVSTLIKFAIYTSCLLYIRICLLHSQNLFFALSKTIHCFLIKIVHCFLHKPYKCNNCANAKNNLCRKEWTIFMRKQWTVLINAKNRFYECGKQLRKYSKHDV